MPSAREPEFKLDWTAMREASLGPSDEAVLVAESNRRLFARWLAAGHGEWMVPRDAFDVIELGGLVGALCVHDRDDATDDYLCRVCGSDIVSDLGIDLTGRMMSSYPDALREPVRKGYDRAFTTRRPLVTVNLLVRTERSAVFPREDGRVVHEKLILPVTRTGRGIDCFITHVARLPADVLAGDVSSCPNGIA